MLREIVYGAGALLALAFAVDFFFSLRDDPREPPRLRPKIPLIGHLIGLIQYGTVYYNATSQQTDAEIYTLGVFNVKIYVCNARRLMPLIQKQSKTLSFRPFLQTAAQKYGGANEDTHRLYGGPLVDDLSQAMKVALAPGPRLDEQNLRMGDRLIDDLNELLGTGERTSKKIELCKWVHDVVVQASACGVYGPDHPFRDPEVTEAFWKWQTFLPAELAGLSVFAREGRRQRAKVLDAYRQYHKADPKGTSFLLRERLRVLREAGVTEEEIIKQEITFPTAIFPNTAATLYWTIWELFSRPDILDEVRREVLTHAITGSKSDGFIVDVAMLKTKCPLLLSVYEETQRLHHIHANIRAVLSDTVLDGRYLLKTGNFLQMPGQPIHTSTDIWGQSASEFDPYRFVPQKGIDRDSIPPSAFLAWGAPPHLCPARQFAATEILIAMAMLALRADIRPSSGIWEKNPALNYGELVTVINPKKDVEVEVTARDEWAGKWDVKMGQSLTRISLASG